MMSFRPSLRFLPALALALLSACTIASRQAAAPATEAALQPPAALHAEGLPPVPQRLLAPIQRWTEVSGHDFVD